MYLGNAKTFVSLLIHLNELKAQLFAKNKKSKTDFIYFESNKQDHPENQFRKEEPKTLATQYSSSQGNLKKNHLWKIPRTITEEK